MELWKQRVSSLCLEFEKALDREDWATAYELHREIAKLIGTPEAA